MSDTFHAAQGQVVRAEAVLQYGHVNLDLRKTAWVPDDKRTGEIHIGLYGVTVTQPNGASVLFPWRVIQNVEIDR